MKKTSLIILVLLTALLGKPAQAAVNQIETYTFSTNTDGVRTATFSITLQSVNAPYTNVADISWEAPDPAVDFWKIAKTMIKVQWNVTDYFGGLQIYTNNKSVVANPRFIDPTPTDIHNTDSNPAGMLYYADGDVTSSYPLPMGWSIKDSPVPSIVDLPVGDLNDGKELLPQDPNNRDPQFETGPANPYQWFYMLDRNTPAIDWNNDGDTVDAGDSKAFFNGDPYVRPVGINGIHSAQGPEQFFIDSDRTAYIYIEANFGLASAESKYKTNQLAIEGFIE